MKQWSSRSTCSLAVICYMHLRRPPSSSAHIFLLKSGRTDNSVHPVQVISSIEREKREKLHRNVCQFYYNEVAFSTNGARYDKRFDKAKCHPHNKTSVNRGDVGVLPRCFPLFLKSFYWIQGWVQKNINKCYDWASEKYCLMCNTVTIFRTSEEVHTENCEYFSLWRCLLTWSINRVCNYLVRKLRCTLHKTLYALCIPGALNINVPASNT